MDDIMFWESPSSTVKFLKWYSSECLVENSGICEKPADIDKAYPTMIILIGGSIIILILLIVIRLVIGS